MHWYEKQSVTVYDTASISGLFFLDGDLISREAGTRWTVDMKAPVIAFSTGLVCQIWGAGEDTQRIMVHLFGELDLLLFTDRDTGFRRADDIAQEVGYQAEKIGESELEVIGQDRGEHFIVTYDNRAKLITDIRRADRPAVATRPTLLDEASRAKLPKLYSGEQKGLDAIAEVKFFTPDSNWTWYASEFDGQDLFFGLVIGFEIELGYFSLTELTEARGPFGLPIERDKFYQPKTLRELQAQHQKERGE